MPLACTALPSPPAHLYSSSKLSPLALWLLISWMALSSSFQVLSAGQAGARAGQTGRGEGSVGGGRGSGTARQRGGAGHWGVGLPA